MILDHSSHKCDVWKLESIPTLVKWNLKAWKNCVYGSQGSLSISLYMVHEHNSWVRLLTFKKPPPSQQNAWLHSKQIKVEFNNTCNLLLAITTFSTSKVIHITKLQHTNQICIQTWKHKKKQIHCKSSNNNNRSSNMYLQNWNKMVNIFMPIRCKLLDHPNFLHLFH